VNLGPTLNDIIWPSSRTGEQSVILRFNSDAANNQGLILRDDGSCTTCCSGAQGPMGNGSAVTVTTSDGMMRRTIVTVVPSSSVVIASAVGIPTGVYVVAVQHNWEALPQCTLFNQDNIPLLPFNRMRM